MNKLLPVFFLASHLILSAAEPHSAINPEPRTGGWVKRHESFNQKVKENQNNIDLIFVGDSITHGWEGKGRDVWARYYGDRKPLNLGIGGDRTQHVLWRLDHGNLYGIKPRAAVVMIGTNNSGDDRNTASEMVDGVRAVVAKLRERVPTMKILLLGIFPRGEKFNAQRGKILQVNQTLQRLHDGESVHYLDIGHRFLNDDGTISKEIMPDFLHFTPRGYGIWADAIEPSVAALLGDKPKAAMAKVAGNWTWSMKGPEDRMVESEMELKVDGKVLTGMFRMREDRTLEIEDGTVDGNKLKFVVKRSRPQGGTMTYRMNATVTGNRIAGEVTTRFNDEEVTRKWQAVRR